MMLSGTQMMIAPPLPAQDLDWILAHTSELWDEMRDQSIFITGGTGFLGCWLLESFCHINRIRNLHARITVLTRDPEAFRRKCPHLADDPALSLILGNTRDFVFPEGFFRYVIHAATETSAVSSFSTQKDVLSSALLGTERALLFASTHGTRKFLFTSSGAVYGPQPPEVTHLPETHTGGPDLLEIMSAYAEGKRLAELLCALYGSQYDLECKIARCWAFCGPHLPLDGHFAIGNFIGDALAGRPIQITGDGTPRRSYLYAADLAIWLWTILFQAPALTPINVGSEHDVGILDVAQAVASSVAPGIAISLGKPPVISKTPARYVPSTARARELLGLRETIPLQDSIERTAAWHRRILPL
jgi:nucleoside-diphosphate-sugar epimerase